jgi:hypothetical protein
VFAGFPVDLERKAKPLVTKSAKNTKKRKQWRSQKDDGLNRVMKKDWNSHIWAKNPIGVTPAKAGVQCFVL